MQESCDTLSDSFKSLQEMTVRERKKVDVLLEQAKDDFIEYENLEGEDVNQLSRKEFLAAFKFEREKV